MAVSRNINEMLKNTFISNIWMKKSAVKGFLSLCRKLNPVPVSEKTRMGISVAFRLKKTFKKKSTLHCPRKSRFDKHLGAGWSIATIRALF